MSKNLVGQAEEANVDHIVKQSAFGSDLEDGITMNKLHRQVEKIILWNKLYFPAADVVYAKLSGS
jgi:uncharacterized protein YbjT (DUF2867 family)